MRFDGFKQKKSQKSRLARRAKRKEDQHKPVLPTSKENYDDFSPFFKPVPPGLELEFRQFYENLPFQGNTKHNGARDWAQ